MKKTLQYFLSLFIIVFLMGLVVSVQAEERTVSIMAPWEGKGRVFMVGPEKLKFLGVFEGIMYIQDAKGALDAAVFVCPAVQEIDAKTNKTTINGNCLIKTENGDLVFAELSLAGVIGASQGTFTITGGTGSLEGITGSGDMLARTTLGATAVNLESGAVLEASAGMALWPELKVNRPDN
jgi:hypothetical protein